MLAENAWTRPALWRFVSADFGVADLAQLPDSALARVEEVPVPVQGRPPRAWGTGETVPVTTGARVDAAALCAAFRSGATTPTAVLERLLDRQTAGDFGAATHSPFVALDPEGARQAAAQSTERWAAGAPRGPLDGVPVPVKDEYDMRGLPTRGGSAWRTDPVGEDAVLVARLRAGGAVLPGKAHAAENGMNPLGFNPHFDYPRNVYSAAHGAGGSSTGSAVAVGLGMAPVAVSSDGGGSIRLPASLNGLFGLKPGLNRMSRTGDIWLGTVGHPGPIGASVSDLVALLEVCAARDPLDAFTHFPPDWDSVVPTWRAALGRGIQGCVIGVLRGEFVDAEPEIARGCEAALKALEAEGATLVDVDIAHLAIVNAIGPLVIAGESAANAQEDLRDHRGAFGDELRLVYGMMRAVNAQTHLRAQRARTGLRQRAAAALCGVDLLALPTHLRLAAPHPASESRQPVSDTAWTAAFTRPSFLANLTGLPAGTAPVGMSGGLPFGLQLLGDAWDEASVIAGLAHLERMAVSDIPLPPSYRPLTET